VNVGLTASAGIGFGILAGEGEFMSDVRALPGMTIEEIEADVRALLAEVSSQRPGLDAEFQLEHWTPPSQIAADHAIVEALGAAAESVLRRRVPLGGFPGGTDAPWFEAAGIPTVPSFGPGLLTLAHTPNESIPVDSLVEAAKLYALAALDYLNA
jgi:acetylornithine deacetylase